jgi:hypothetical protein
VTHPALHHECAFTHSSKMNMQTGWKVGWPSFVDTMVRGGKEVALGPLLAEALTAAYYSRLR